MATLESCPTCGHQTSENADRCPSCGEPLGAGWVDEVRERRRQEVEEAKRAKLEATRARKKLKRKRRLVGIIVIAGLFTFVVGPQLYESYRLRNLKEIDPVAYRHKVEELEAQVAKVPATDFDGNIRLYRQLRDLDPENNLYAEKIKHYQQKKAAAEKAAEEAEKAAKAKKIAAEAAAKVAAEAARKRKGFHCLSAWDGSHRGVKKYVEERMRDPDSFEHIETRVTPVDENGRHTLVMKYRARNGFGGMTVGVALANYNNSDCSATITSIQ